MPTQGAGSVEAPDDVVLMQKAAGARRDVSILPPGWALVLALHVPLAMAVQAVPYIGLLHKALTCLYAVRMGFQGRDRVAMLSLGAYVVGSEVLWRMVDAPGPWEVGKYTLIIMFGWAMLRRRSWLSIGMPALYLLLHLPSIAMWGTWSFGLNMRNALGNDLSGPVALAVATMFCSRVELDRNAVGRALLWLLAPVLSILVLCVVGTAGAAHLTFRTSSLDVTSGGFGPNQVAAVLCLGALAILLVILAEPGWRPRHAGMLLLGVGLAAQSALTFSRGGLYNLAGALAAGAAPLMSSVRHRGRIVALLGLTSLVSVWWVAPSLVAFTEGAVEKRFANTSTTGRDQVVLGDLMLFAQYPVLGVGVGVSQFVRPLTDKRPHVEYSRLLAEHGSLGVLALILLVVMAVRAAAVARTPYARCLALSFGVWSLLYLGHSAMRLAAPAFVFGLAMVTLRIDEDAARSGEREGETPVLTAGRVPRTRRRVRKPEQTH